MQNAFSGEGILVYQHLEQLLNGKRAIKTEKEIAPGQIQPCSLDLRLSNVALRVKAPFTPKPGQTVQEALEDRVYYTLDLESGHNLLERGQTYVIPLLESLDLPEGFWGHSNPKSSSGRIDLWARLIADGVDGYDMIPEGFKGKLYLEVTPLSFHVRAHPLISLNQLRLFYGKNIQLSDAELKILYEETPLLFDKEDQPIPREKVKIDNGLVMTIDLEGWGDGIVGYQAKKNLEPIDLAKIAHYDFDDYFEQVKRPKNGLLDVDKDGFFLFSSNERISVEGINAAEMALMEPSMGLYLSHAAGFFDKGWNAFATGEVRALLFPLQIYDDKPFCKMIYQRCLELPKKDGKVIAYGDTMFDSHYVEQVGPTWAKYFRKKEKKVA